nr:hypothetical protein BaRGS_021888 [Batillaria attramentaria]
MADEPILGLFDSDTNFLDELTGGAADLGGVMSSDGDSMLAQGMQPLTSSSDMGPGPGGMQTPMMMNQQSQPGQGGYQQMRQVSQDGYGGMGGGGTSMAGPQQGMMGHQYSSADGGYGQYNSMPKLHHPGEGMMAVGMQHQGGMQVMQQQQQQQFGSPPAGGMMQQHAGFPGMSGNAPVQSSTGMGMGVSGPLSPNPGIRQGMGQGMGPQSGIAMEIQRLEKQIQHLFSLPKTQQISQQMLDLQERMRILKAQQQQQIMQMQRQQQSQQQQQQQQQTPMGSPTRMPQKPGFGMQQHPGMMPQRPRMPGQMNGPPQSQMPGMPQMGMGGQHMGQAGPVPVMGSQASQQLKVQGQQHMGQQISPQRPPSQSTPISSPQRIQPFQAA